MMVLLQKIASKTFANDRLRFNCWRAIWRRRLRRAKKFQPDATPALSIYHFIISTTRLISVSGQHDK